MRGSTFRKACIVTPPKSERKRLMMDGRRCCVVLLRRGKSACVEVGPCSPGQGHYPFALGRTDGVTMSGFQAKFALFGILRG